MSEPMEPICTYGSGDEAARYLCAAMDEPEAAAYEEHYFGCEECARELELGAGIRPARMARRKRVRAIWGGLAAAAALAAIFAGSGVMMRRDSPPAAPAWRSDSAPLMATVTRRDGALEIRWNRVAGASFYLIGIYSADGRPIRQISATSPEAAIGADAIGGSPSPLYLRIEALDAQGSLITRSPLQALR